MSTESLIQPRAEKETAIAVGRAQAFLASALELVIDSPERRELAANFRSQIRAAQKQLEENRIALVKPLNDHVKRINDAFREVGAALERAIGIVDAKILNDRREQERLALEARRKAEEEAARLRAQAEAEARAKAEQEAKAAGYTKEDAAEVAFMIGADAARAVVPPAPAIAAPPKTLRAESGATLSVKKVWTFSVLELLAVPPEYLMLDTAKVRQAIRDGVRSIPGLRIYQDDQVAGR